MMMQIKYEIIHKIILLGNRVLIIAVKPSRNHFDLNCKMSSVKVFTLTNSDNRFVLAFIHNILA